MHHFVIFIYFVFCDSCTVTPAKLPLVHALPLLFVLRDNCPSVVQQSGLAINLFSTPTQTGHHRRKSLLTYMEVLNMNNLGRDYG